MSGALDTLIPQSFGSGNLILSGIYLNRGRFVLLASAIPIGFVLFNSETILIALG